MHIECVQQANAILGEWPIWDPRLGVVYWVDIRRGEVYRYSIADREQTGRWVLPARVGAVALTEDPARLLVAHGLSVDWLHLATARREQLCRIEASPQYRVNDAAVDPAGRLWIGTMIDDFHSPPAFVGGGLHCVDVEGKVSYRGEYQLPNGIGWSPDHQTMYLNDSAAGKTYAFDFDQEAGECTNRRDFVTFPAGQGLPDGLSVDAGGDVWSAMWDGWRLVRFASDGRLVGEYRMPVQRPAGVTFCGDDLRHMLITSATVDFGSERYAGSPSAGGLFLVDAGVAGQAAGLFGRQTAAVVR